MIKEIFTAIQTKISTDVLAIRWIDFDLGQFEDEMPSVSFPAVLVGFSNTTFENIGRGAQIGNQLLTIRIGFKLRERTHNKAQQQFRDDAIAHLDTLEAVRITIATLNGNNFNAPRLLSESNEQRAAYRIYTLTYECTTFAASPTANQYTPYVNVTPTLPPLQPCVHVENL